MNRLIIPSTSHHTALSTQFSLLRRTLGTPNRSQTMMERLTPGSSYSSPYHALPVTLPALSHDHDRSVTFTSRCDVTPLSSAHGCGDTCADGRAPGIRTTPARAGSAPAPRPDPVQARDRLSATMLTVSVCRPAACLVELRGAGCDGPSGLGSRCSRGGSGHHPASAP